MPNYKRRYCPGCTFFFTVMLAPQTDPILIRSLDLLRHAYRKTLEENPFETLAIVILPDHLHAIWRLPEGDADYPLRWRKIKARFSRLSQERPKLRDSHLARSERGIWQRRYWEHQIRDRTDFQKHLAYCWSDPVRHGLVERTADWSASSFHRDARRGVVPLGWTTGPISGDFGERSSIEAETA